MRQRVATFATIFALVGGTGGAVAFAGGGSDNGNGNGGAAHGQYCEGHGKEHGRDHAKHDDCTQGDDHHTAMSRVATTTVTVATTTPRMSGRARSAGAEA